jgi:hypothetical protein
MRLQTLLLFFLFLYFLFLLLWGILVKGVHRNAVETKNWLIWILD